MRNFLCICVVLISFAACKPGIPKDIIQPDKMTDVLYNVHLVDGYITTIPGQDSAKKVSAAYYKGIYKKFAVDSALYNKSMNYYYDHPDVLSKMYDRITEKLKKTKISVDKIEAKRVLKETKKLEAAAKKTRDSLKNLEIKRLPKGQAEKKMKKDSIDKVKAKIKSNPRLTKMVNPQ